ncbi:MAG: hypothetical protein SF028_10435 [Candidatus Sumerlaeia bacterium]|nr:hypothetical protein [Candidatus Sumerlaeia bacterium]
MKVAIYRSSADAVNECVAALLGTPEWAVEELLLATGIDTGRAGSGDAAPEEGDAPWTSAAFDPEEIPGVPKPRVASEEADFPAHRMSAVVVQLRQWNTGATLAEVLGDGWWRFLSEDGEERYVDTAAEEGANRPPRLLLERRGGMLFIAGGGSSPSWTAARHEGRLHLVDQAGGEPQAGVFFIPDAKVETIACQLLQSLREQVRVLGVGIRRGDSPDEGKLRLALLFMDTDPDDSAEPPAPENDDTLF